jgi:hypothetical protein
LVRFVFLTSPQSSSIVTDHSVICSSICWKTCPTNPSSCNSDTHESLRAEKLQKNRRVVGRPACRCGLDAFEAEIRQIERVDKGIHHTNGIALLDPLIKAFRQQRRLSAIGTPNEALHELPRQIAKRIIADSSFSRSQGQWRPCRDDRYWRKAATHYRIAFRRSEII